MATLAVAAAQAEVTEVEDLATTATTTVAGPALVEGAGAADGAALVRSG